MLARRQHRSPRLAALRCPASLCPGDQVVTSGYRRRLSARPAGRRRRRGRPRQRHPQRRARPPGVRPRRRLRHRPMRLDMPMAATSPEHKRAPASPACAPTRDDATASASGWIHCAAPPLRVRRVRCSMSPSCRCHSLARSRWRRRCPLIAVFYWALWRPDLMPAWAVFALGLAAGCLIAACRSAMSALRAARRSCRRQRAARSSLG